MGNPPILNGAQPQNSCGCFQFYGGCHAVDAHVGSLIFVSPEPFGSLVLCLLYGFKDVLSQPFAANRAVIALDIGVLLRLAGLDVFYPDIVLLSPFHELSTDIFRSVVYTNCLRLTTPFDDLV